MGICICCGAATQKNYKICIECHEIARHNPCMVCTVTTGRTPGCADSCERKQRWNECNRTVLRLKREQEAARLLRKYDHRRR